MTATSEVGVGSARAGRRTQPQFHTLTVASVDRLTDDSAAVTFDVPADLAEAFAFDAGQSLTIRRTIDGAEHRRTYSICAPAGPASPDRRTRDPRRCVLLVAGPRGHARHRDRGAAADRQLPCRPRRPRAGTCASPPGPGSPRCCRSPSTVLENPDAHVTLLYGNRTSGSVMFTEELSDLKNRYGPRFQLVHVLSREPRDVELFSGRLDADRLRRLLAAFVPVPALDHVWLCGPFAMINDARETLTDLGVDEDRVHFELFYVDEPPPELHRPDAVVSGETSAVTVVLDGLSATAPMSRDMTILDAAQVARTDLPFACKGGVCGTCRALVTEGEVDMRRNYALEKAEVEAGFVLTCQSFPVSDDVTVDFDA